MNFGSLSLARTIFFFTLPPAFVFSNPVPDYTEAIPPIITPAPDVAHAVLFRRDQSTCGYIWGDPSSPDVCRTNSCQYYAPTGYPGLKFCTTEGYIPSAADYATTCFDYGVCAGSSTSCGTETIWRTCEDPFTKYCGVIEYAARSGAIVEYQAFSCWLNTLSRTLFAYFETTTPASPTTIFITPSSATPTSNTPGFTSTSITPTPSATTSIPQVSTSASSTPTSVQQVPASSSGQSGTSSIPTPTPTAPSSTHQGLDSSSIVGLVCGIVAAVIAIVGIFTAAFVDTFRYWVLFSIPNALCCGHRQPAQGSALYNYVHGVA